MKSIITICAVIALGCASASAAEGKKPEGDKPKHTPEEIYKKLDVNADGKVSYDEWKAGPRAKKDPTKAEESFKKLDADSDGGVSLDEFKAQQHGGKGGKGGKKGQAK